MTNRAQLLNTPTKGDECDLFVPGTPDGLGDCRSDGHYLCDECTRLSPLSFHCREMCHLLAEPCDGCVAERADEIIEAKRQMEKAERLAAEAQAMQEQAQRLMGGR